MDAIYKENKVVIPDCVIEEVKPNSNYVCDKFQVTMEGDENDADYTYETTLLSKKDFEEYLPILLKIKNSQHHNWNGENCDEEDFCLTEDEFYKTEDLYPPYREFGYHTMSISSIIYIDTNGFERHVTLINT